MKFTTVKMPESLHYKFTNKCRYHDYTFNEILVILITNFAEGKYDEDLGLTENRE